MVFSSTLFLFFLFSSSAGACRMLCGHSPESDESPAIHFILCDIDTDPDHFHFVKNITGEPEYVAKNLSCHFSEQNGIYSHCVKKDDSGKVTDRLIVEGRKGVDVEARDYHLVDWKYSKLDAGGESLDTLSFSFDQSKEDCLVVGD